MNIISFPPQKHKRKKRQPRASTPYKWLRDRVSRFDYGTKYLGSPIHSITKLDIAEHYLKRKKGDETWLPRLTNAKLDDHFLGRMTFYFSGNGDIRAKETIAEIDIDCHASGTFAGATAFAEFLKNGEMPNLYFEPSTNGNGIHGIIIVEKDGFGAEITNQALKRLDHKLKELAKGFDIENVEVKGTCPVFQWGDEMYELQGYKCGQLAKLPRDVNRFKEWQNTYRTSIHELLKLPPAEKPARETKDIAITRPVGSIAGKAIDEDELERMRHYRQVATVLLENHVVETSGRAVVTEEDLAIFLLITKFMSNNMNPDGTMPWQRIRGMWDSLYQAGDVSRSHDPKRHKAMRDYLSSLGLIDWTDQTYVIGERASKWQLSEVLMNWLEASVSVAKGQDQNETVIDQKREAPFTGTTISTEIKSLVRLSENETIVPCEVLGMPPLRLQPDTITAIVTAKGDPWALAA